MTGQYEITAPDPAGTLAGLKALGYSLGDALADLIDNSIAAHARTVHVEADWNGSDPWIAVADDGDGMDEDTLRTAMTLAGVGAEAARSSTDLGRFGLGLKTASFSQAGQLTVATSDGSQWRHRVWDLDVVRETGQWRLGLDIPYDAVPVMRTLQDTVGGPHGTVVLLRKMDRRDDTPASFDKDLYAALQHLEMVFHRFLTSGRLTITVNGTCARGWDPFLRQYPQTQERPTEKIPLLGHTVTVTGYVLPHRRYLDEQQYIAGGGPKGWTAQQGFYMYRRDRIIVPGSWLGLRIRRDVRIHRDERSNLARLAVDVPAELDTTWQLDVRKSTATPPAAIRDDLVRAARDALHMAHATVITRVRKAERAPRSTWTASPWLPERSRDGKVRCLLDWKHPLVRAVLAGDDSGQRRALLTLLRETVPVANLRMLHEAETDDDPEPFMPDTVGTEVARDTARKLYEAMVSGGSPPHDARTRIEQIPWLQQIGGLWEDTTPQKETP